MAQRDPFESYRRRREIELMESRFKEKAAAQRRRLEDILSQDAEPGELEKRVTEEMEEFLAESTRTAERMIEDFREEDEEPERPSRSGPARSTESEASPRSEQPVEHSPMPRKPKEPSKEPSKEAPKEVRKESRREARREPRREPRKGAGKEAAPPRPSIRERRPLGASPAPSKSPLDLNEALARIKKHQETRTSSSSGPPDRESGQGDASRSPGRSSGERPPRAARHRRPPGRAPAREPRRPPRGAEQPPDPNAPAVGDMSKSEILSSFDETFQQVSELIQRRMEAEGLDAPVPGDGSPSPRESGPPPANVLTREETFDFGRSARAAPESETAAEGRESAPPGDAASLYRERIRRSGAMLGNEAEIGAGEPDAGPLADPDAGAGADEGGMPGGVTNVFSSEPDEDRDIDDDLDTEGPAGWNLPVRPPPPGAWVVRKQKEEGEAALAGVAGDTYLLKKMSREVRVLNAVYLVLLEKGVVTREEVEGDGEAAPPRPERKPRPESDDEDDDDVVTVDDYDEDRYRPIDTSDKDFSLSALVQDIHRLKGLRDVLVKKGVVTEKEIEKAKK